MFTKFDDWTRQVGTYLQTVIVCAALSLNAVASATDSRIEVHDSLNSLPRATVVPVPLADVRDSLLRGLQASAESKESFYQQHGYRSGDYLYQEFKSASDMGPTYMSAESKGAAVFGKRFFADPRNAERLYVHAYGEVVESSYYFAERGPLGYSANYAIALSAQDQNHSLIAVSSMNSTVYFGREFSWHAFGFVPKARPVAASPTEEYRLLVYAAHLVGTDLPPLEEKSGNIR